MKSFSTPFLVALFLLCVVIMFGCRGCVSDDGNRYETRYSADGKDSVVYVRYRDNNGQYQDFFLNYLMFRSLFGNGGYNGYSACHNYYNSHPATRVNNYHTYVVREHISNYTQSTGSTSSGSSGSSSKSFWNSGSSSGSSYSSPSRSSSSSRSYSSPSRSYSSPSRSYSSPSRSYSSPSRSYSSPSRSYSSPSRH